MEHKLILRSILPLVLFLALAPAALASSTWYVDGVNGNDSNDCLSSQTACQTIGHAISLTASGDSIMVAPAVYVENLVIKRSLKIIGSDTATTIIDGNRVSTVITIPNKKVHVHLSKLTIRKGLAEYGGGISNSGKLTIKESTVTGNWATADYDEEVYGGGIYNGGTLTISNTTISGNRAEASEDLSGGGGIYNRGVLLLSDSIISDNQAGTTDGGWSGGGGIKNDGTLRINNSAIMGNEATPDIGSGNGAGIDNSGTLTMNQSTVSGNWAAAAYGEGYGGGIHNDYAGTLIIDNSTINGNTAGSNAECSGYGGGIENSGSITVNNSTIDGNTATTSGYEAYGGGILNQGPATISSSTISRNSTQDGGGGIDGTVTLQNTIIANNSGGNGNCSGTMTSNGYNLSSDGSCNFSGSGDMNNTEPKLGKLKDNGGPTQTIRLLPASPAIDAGNPNGCTDDQGHLLKTDQRGWLRPDNQSGRCDIGAFERQIK